MQPRGNVKLLIEAMQAEPDKPVWTPDECRPIVGDSVSASLSPAVRHGWLFRHELGGRRVGYSLKPPGGEQATEDDVVEFDACMWGGSGDLIIYGADATEDGGIVLTPKQQAVIKRLITWTPPA